MQQNLSKNKLKGTFLFYVTTNSSQILILLSRTNFKKDLLEKQLSECLQNADEDKERLDKFQKQVIRFLFIHKYKYINYNSFFFKK